MGGTRPGALCTFGRAGSVGLRKKAPSLLARDCGERAPKLAEMAAEPAVDELTGDELFVRATVISSRSQPNPAPGEAAERAWCQPWVPATR